MKCERCDAEWNTEMKIEYPSRCPFCGTVLWGLQQDSAGILREIIKKHGTGIIEDSNALCNMIAEYLSHDEILEFEQLSLLKRAIEAGVGDILCLAIGKDRYWWYKQKKIAVNYITEKIGIDENSANSVTDIFAYALGFKKIHVKKEFHDEDCAYYDLSEKYRESDTTIANTLLMTSARSGNISAISTVVGEMYECWEDYIDAKTWYKWCVMASEEGNQFSGGAEFEIAIAKLYGIGTSPNEDQALKDLLSFENDYLEAKLEISARRICGLLKFHYPFQKAIDNIYQAAEFDLLYASCITEQLDISGWIDELEMIQDSAISNENYYQGKLAYIISEYFRQNNNDTKREAWLNLSIKKGNVDAKMEEGMHLINADTLGKRRSGFRILETTNVRSAQHIVAKELQNGVLVKRDLRRAFEIICKYNDLDFLFMKGKAYYYGWGCEIDINKAIECFESYLHEASRKSKDDESLGFHLYLSTPFLIQLYYEDMIQNNSLSSLNKLEKLADNSNCRMAMRYLYKWYSDSDNQFFDSIKARRYSNRIKTTEEGLFVQENAILDVKNYYWKEYNEYQSELEMRKNDKPKDADHIFLFQNHLLLEVIICGKSEDMLDKYIDENANMYVRMAFLLTQDHIGFKKNYLRSCIFYDLYLEIKKTTDDNYQAALINYSIIIIEHYLTRNKLKKALSFIKKYTSYNRDKEHGKKITLYVLIKASIKSLEQQDLLLVEELLRKAEKSFE